MRSFEIPGTPYFVQPLTVPWRTPLFSWNHSTSREDNWLSPNTLVVRAGFLPLALAFGRWETVPEVEIKAREHGENVRSWFAQYNAVNDPVEWSEFCRAWYDLTGPADRDLEVDEIMGALQASLSTWREPTSVT